MNERTSHSRFSRAIEICLGGEEKSIAGLFRIGALRLVMLLPIAITFSGSATIFLTYATGLFWLFGGQWRKRAGMLFGSRILWVSIPLILWTTAGVVRYENSFFESLKYLLGHYPYIFIVIFATILHGRDHRQAMFSSINLGIVLCCLWAIGFSWYYRDLSHQAFVGKRVLSIYLYRNTICFGMALALWGGIWACFPYASRHIAWVRRLLPRRLLKSMALASRISIPDFFKISTAKLFFCRPAAFFLAILRWGIVLSVPVYLFFFNPSRTAQLAVIVGYAVLLFFGNWKKGIIAIILLFIPFVALSGLYSDLFASKTSRTVKDVRLLFEALDATDGLESFSRSNRDRLGIHTALLPDMLERPLVGYGMERAVKIVLEKTRYNDPHSEFIYMIIQQGLIGLACFVFWLIGLAVGSCRLASPWNGFGIFLVAIVCIDCFFNNALSYHRETFLLCLSVALLAAQEYATNPKDREFFSRRSATNGSEFRMD